MYFTENSLYPDRRRLEVFLIIIRFIVSTATINKKHSARSGVKTITSNTQ